VRLVIDFGAIAHAVRRCWWRKFGKPSVNRCAGCGRKLTRDEAYFYICHCERCEGIAMQELERAA